MTVQAPGFQATTQETSRVLKRGELENFFFGFFYDQAQQQPVSPIDPTTHPNYRIFDPSGAMLADGVCAPANAPGFWRVAWFVPRDAQLTNVNNRYRFQTIMVDANFRQFETSFEFDVVESAVPEQMPEAVEAITPVGEGIRLHFHNTVRPDMLRMKVVRRGQDNNPLFAATWTYPVPSTPGPNTILEAQMGTYYSYYVDIPALPQTGDYIAQWICRDFPQSAQDFSTQTINVIDTSVTTLMSRLRMYIDKLQKKMGIVYAYRNEEIIAYLQQGMGTINQGVPPTYFTLTNVPPPLESLLIMASMVWGLTAQRLLYAETNFDFGGQTVTVGYNPGADLDSMIDRLNTAVNDQLRKTKEGIVRARSNVGFFAGRPVRWNSGLVFRTGGLSGTAGGDNIMQLLTYYGIPIGM